MPSLALLPSVKKLNGNAARDQLHQRALRQLGWHPVVIWECQTEKPGKLARLQTRLKQTLSAARPLHPPQ
jgi:G:T-mismatch repair DNA endonuclease (very short patch repair protein)